MKIISILFLVLVVPLQSFGLLSRVDLTYIEDVHSNTDPMSDWRPDTPRETQTADEDEVRRGTEPTATQSEETREEEARSDPEPTTETDSETRTVEEKKKKPDGHDEDRGREEEEKRMLVGGLDYRERRINQKHEEDEREKAKHNEGFGTEDREIETVERKTDGGHSKLSVNQDSNEPIGPPSATPHDLTPVTSFTPTLLPGSVTQPASRSQDPPLDTAESLVRGDLIMVPSVIDSPQSRLREGDRFVSQAKTVDVVPTVSVSINPKQHGAAAVLVNETEKSVMQLKTTAKPPKTIDKLQQTQTVIIQTCPTVLFPRVVQCSDKGVQKVPYGIPYNSRYVLLMNNHINTIQLDLLSEYLFMEFLVLSNNRLTDGSIEGALEGIPALRRLYLDRNLLESVPADLPDSLEELRLDNNRVGTMSEPVWACCPRLLVLNLSNNSLGNGSDTLPAGVFLPLGSLRTLSLDNNRLASVPLGLPLSIRELYLRGNLIQTFPGEAFVGTSELTILDLSANRLTDRGLIVESLTNTTNLESLNLEGNLLKRVPRHLPSSLKTLNLEGNLISSVGRSSFLHLPHLEHLGLARNRISRVASGALRALLVLHQLDLSHNALRQVPRQLPRGLNTIAATHNQIRVVPRDAFCWGGSGLSNLVKVQLENNLIDLGHLNTKAFRCLRGFQVIHFN
ncbi:hypothetical protein DPEC_G00114940 [Dallia pectoralis]|uniref:Uncharacterized protein n=1 Tax=Dallia pectoralis TaxID=75939 RepID=A0ACC2GUB4_DALPE|nr:hypothetical protein DPEC_G00114940 [Dallia pectoralis]